MKSIFMLLLLGFIAALVIGTVVDKTATYSPWSSDMQIDVARTMVQNGIGGCGVIEFRQKSSAAHSEWEVRCSRDGQQNWRYYLAFVSTGKVLGPYSSESEIP